jgi:transposase
MSYMQGVSRQQGMLLPESVEDYVGADNAVRVIDGFVEGLDLEALGLELRTPGSPGAPGYDPRVLLKLFIYGYLNRIRSSRELEKAARRNLEVIWLLGRLTPDHWTINEFRRVQRALFKGVLRQFNVLCGGLGLFGAELVAIDGTFLKAVNSPARNFSQGKLRRLIEEIDRRAEGYLEALETAEREAPAQSLGAGGGGEPQERAAQIKEHLASLGQKRRECAGLLEALEAAGPDAQLSQSDADSRALQKNAQRVVGYNAQIAVDSAHHMIVAEEVTTEPNDRALLAPMAEAAKQTLGVAQLTVVADSGYYSTGQLQRCAAQGVEAYVPSAQSRPAGSGEYPLERFTYDEARDHYLCPQGRVLRRHSDVVKNSGPHRVYYDTAACRHCAGRARCTGGAYRKLMVHQDHEFITACRARLQRHPDIMSQRRALAEHPFGTLKFWLGYGAFLTRGLAMVRAEFSLGCLAYNLRRALNVLGTRRLLQALQT